MLLQTFCHRTFNWPTFSWWPELLGAAFRSLAPPGTLVAVCLSFLGTWGRGGIPVPEHSHVPPSVSFSPPFHRALSFDLVVRHPRANATPHRKLLVLFRVHSDYLPYFSCQVCRISPEPPHRQPYPSLVPAVVRPWGIPDGRYPDCNNFFPPLPPRPPCSDFPSYSLPPSHLVFSPRV